MEKLETVNAVGCTWPVIARVEGLTYRCCEWHDPIEGVAAELRYNKGRMVLHLVGSPERPRSFQFGGQVDVLLPLRIMAAVDKTRKQVINSGLLAIWGMVITEANAMTIAEIEGDDPCAALMVVRRKGFEDVVDELGKELVAEIKCYSWPADQLDNLLLNLSINGCVIDWRALEREVGCGRAPYTPAMERRSDFLPPTDYVKIQERLELLRPKEVAVWEGLSAQLTSVSTEEVQDDSITEVMEQVLRQLTLRGESVSDAKLVMVGVMTRLVDTGQFDQLNLPVVYRLAAQAAADQGYEILNPVSLFAGVCDLLVEVARAARAAS